MAFSRSSSSSVFVCSHHLLPVSAVIRLSPSDPASRSFTVLRVELPPGSGAPRRRWRRRGARGADGLVGVRRQLLQLLHLLLAQPAHLEELEEGRRVLRHAAAYERTVPSSASYCMSRRSCRKPPAAWKSPTPPRNVSDARHDRSDDASTRSACSTSCESSSSVGLVHRRVEQGEQAARGLVLAQYVQDGTCRLALHLVQHRGQRRRRLRAERGAGAVQGSDVACTACACFSPAPEPAARGWPFSMRPCA